MQQQTLVRMANDIAAFFAAEPDPAAGARAVADHLRRFWEPRMRHALVTYEAEGGAGLSDLARRGVRQLAATPVS